MTADTKNLLDMMLVAVNIAFAISAFVMTLWINAKNSRIENKLKSLNLFMDKETDLRLEAKRIAMDKCLKLMTSIDSMFDKLKTLNDSNNKEIDKYLKITLRKEYYDVQIYLPNNISNAIFEFLASCIRAVGHQSLPEKYWNIMEDVSKKYTELIIIIRKTFYFETTDLAPMVEAEISRTRDTRNESAL